jgi:hypothetical protein
MEVTMNFLTLLNKERARLGRPLLKESSLLRSIAQRKATLIATGEFSHSSGGLTEEALRASFHYPEDGKQDEVICWSEADAEGAFAAFMDSPVHRRVLLDADYRFIGVAGPLGEIGKSRHWGSWAVEIGTVAGDEAVSDDADKRAKHEGKKERGGVVVDGTKNPAESRPVSTPVVTIPTTGGPFTVAARPAQAVAARAPGVITRKTPFRQIGPVSLATFREVLVSGHSPIAPIEEVYRIAGNMSALALVQMRRESSLGTSELAKTTKNPLGLKLPDNSGFCTYGCWATAIAEWRWRLTDPGYKDGVYYPEAPAGDPVNLSLEDYLTIYVGGPICLSSGMRTCANTETRESVNRYIDAVVTELNDLLDTTPTPAPGGDVVYGRVPKPEILNKIIPGDAGGGVWVPVGRNSAFDFLGKRTFRGFCVHIMEGTLEGTDQYFRGDARMRALTDFGIGWSPSLNGTKIFQWNSLAGGRAPWASGPATDVEGDGHAFIAAYGVNAINRDLRSIEFAGRENEVLKPELLTLAVQLMAYLADSADNPVSYKDWPYRNGVPLIYGHREFGPKPCPGDWLWNQIPGMSDRVGVILRDYQTGAK